jgi:hypothetical protein
MRHPDWATRLDAYIAAAASMPFSYNSAMGLDCCTFTWGAIHAQTGIPIGSRFAGTYSTKRESLVAMKNYCGRPSLLLAIAKLMAENKFDRCRPLFAQRGDVLLTPTSSRDWFLGLLDLNGRDVLSVGEHGVRRVPISIRCRAWRIS